MARLYHRGDGPANAVAAVTRVSPQGGRGNRSRAAAFIAAPAVRSRTLKDVAMRIGVREPLRSTEDPVIPSAPPARRLRRRVRASQPLAAEDTALPGHLLVLLSRLHRAEAAPAEAAEAARPASP
jgi:hypothetical protein